MSPHTRGDSPIDRGDRGLLLGRKDNSSSTLSAAPRTALPTAQHLVRETPINHKLLPVPRPSEACVCMHSGEKSKIVVLLQLQRCGVLLLVAGRWSLEAESVGGPCQETSCTYRLGRSRAGRLTERLCQPSRLSVPTCVIGMPKPFARYCRDGGTSETFASVASNSTATSSRLAVHGWAADAESLSDPKLPPVVGLEWCRCRCRSPQPGN